MSIKRNAAIVSAIVAGLFVSTSYAADAPAGAMATTATVNCLGVNSCKGMGACKTATNACKGMNSCKAKGITQGLTSKECTDKGGTVTQ
jgi:hypothetical protein